MTKKLIIVMLSFFMVTTSTVKPSRAAVQYAICIGPQLPYCVAGMTILGLGTGSYILTIKAKNKKNGLKLRIGKGVYSALTRGKKSVYLNEFPDQIEHQINQYLGTSLKLAEDKNRYSDVYKIEGSLSFSKGSKYMRAHDFKRSTVYYTFGECQNAVLIIEEEAQLYALNNLYRLNEVIPLFCVPVPYPR